MFRLELSDTKIMKDSFNSISKIVDEVVCNVDSEGFSLSAMDRSHICFVFLNLKASVFDEYICDAPDKICIDTAEFMRILKRIKGNDVLKLSIDNNNLIIGLHGDVDREFKIRLIDLDYETPAPPSMEFPSSASVGSTIVNDAITDMELFSEKLYFILDEDYFIVNADGEFGDANFKYLHGEEGVNETVKACYSIPKLKDIFQASKFSDVVEVSLGNDMPLGLKFELITGDGELRYLLAPRLEVEEE